MSEWKEGAAKRRDTRATKTDGTIKPKAKKDTKRWCKGKVGREHVFTFVEVCRFFDRIYGHDLCANCGKRNWKSNKINERN